MVINQRKIIRLSSIPEEKRDGYTCMIAFVQNPLLNRHLIPHDIFNTGFCLEAIRRNPKTVECLPEHMYTEDFFRKAVDANPAIIKYPLYPKHITEEIEFTAVSKRPLLFEYLSDPPYRTCLAAVSSTYAKKNLMYVPLKNRTRELCKVALMNGANIDDVPKEIRDAELYKAAVEHNPENILSVPKEYRTRDLCLRAVKLQGNVFECMDEYQDDQEFQLEAVKRDGAMLQFIENPTYEMCYHAVKSSPYGIAWVGYTDFKDNKELELVALYHHGSKLIDTLECMSADFLDSDYFKNVIREAVDDIELEVHKSMHERDEGPSLRM